MRGVCVGVVANCRQLFFSLRNCAICGAFLSTHSREQVQRAGTKQRAAVFRLFFLGVGVVTEVLVQEDVRASSHFFSQCTHDASVEVAGHTRWWVSRRDLWATHIGSSNSTCCR